MNHCIVYFSTWNQQYPQEDLATLLAQSRQNNLERGITGVTLYVRGNIIQVLEGEPQAVQGLYERICQDERHQNLTKVLDRAIGERLFVSYWMGYETITEEQLAEIRQVVDLDTPFQAAEPVAMPAILTTIRAFYQSNRHN